MRKYLYFILSISLLSCLPFTTSFAEELTPKTLSKYFPKIKAAIDDGFFRLAEMQAADVLSDSPSKKEKYEAVLLMAHALWGQKRYLDMLAMLDGYEDKAGIIYWRARGKCGLKKYDEAHTLLIDFENTLAHSDLAATTLRLKGHIELLLEQPEQAANTFLQFSIQFPQSAYHVNNQFDLATAYLKQNKIVEAENILKNLITEANENASQKAVLRLGELLYGQGDASRYPEARDLLTKLAEDEENELAYRIDAWIDIATLEEKIKDRDSAQKALREAISLSPDAQQRVPLKLALARFLLRGGDTENALKFLEACRAEVPNESLATEIQLEKADALLMANRYEQADSAYQIYLDVSTNEQGRANAYHGKGVALWQLERYMEAAVAFDKAVIKLQPSLMRKESLFKAADCYYKANRFDEAILRYQRFIDEYDNDLLRPNALYQLAMAHNEAGKSDEALAIFESIEKTYPTSTFAEEAALRAADIDFAMRRWESVLKRYNRITQTYTNNAAVVSFSLYRSGRVLYKLGRYDESLQAFDAVLTQYPKSTFAPQSLFMRGRCLFDQGNDEEAIATCESFIEKYPNSTSTPRVLFWLAEQRYNAGIYLEASELFHRIASDYDDQTLAARALYWAGRAADAQTDYMKAIEYYSKVAKNYPSSDILPITRFSQSDALIQLGEFSAAILACEEIIKKYPDSPLVNAAWGRIGDCKFSMGKENPTRYAESIQAYQSILDRPSARLTLKIQAESKMGRSYEKMGELEKAFIRYMNVIYTFMNEPTERSADTILWFTRAAYGAAALKEKQHKWVDAVQIYRRVLEADVPASEEAIKRINKIKSDNWLLFQQIREVNDVGTND